MREVVGGKEMLGVHGDRALGDIEEGEKIEEKRLWERKMMGRLFRERGERKETKKET